MHSLTGRTKDLDREQSRNSHPSQNPGQTWTQEPTQGNPKMHNWSEEEQERMKMNPDEEDRRHAGMNQDQSKNSNQTRNQNHESSRNQSGRVQNPEYENSKSQSFDQNKTQSSGNQNKTQSSGNQNKTHNWNDEEQERMKMSSEEEGRRHTTMNQNQNKNPNQTQNQDHDNSTRDQSGRVKEPATENLKGQSNTQGSSNQNKARDPNWSKQEQDRTQDKSEQDRAKFQTEEARGEKTFANSAQEPGLKKGKEESQGLKSEKAGKREEQSAKRGEQSAKREEQSAGKSDEFSASEMLKVNSENDWEGLKQGQKPVIVDFYKQGCGVCKRMYPKLIEKAKSANGKWVFAGADIEGDKIKALATTLHVGAAPTVMLFHKGKLIDQFTGQDEGHLNKLVQKAEELSR